MGSLSSKITNIIDVNNNTELEFLLDPKNNRFSAYPIKYPEIWNYYKIQEASIWFVEEIDFSKDADDFNKLSENEQHFIKMILAFFSSSDTIVNINLCERFLKDIQIREAIFVYTFQMAMESIHSETYSLQIENIIKDPEEKDILFNAIEKLDCVANKINWAFKWIESNSSFPKRLIAFAIFEGIFFSGSFCAIFWLKKRNIMPGLCSSNELIARDEGVHCNFAILLYSMIQNKLSTETIHLMFSEAVDIEINFICECLPCSLIGMNSELMILYIKYVADRLLTDLKYPKIYNVENPFDFMESISVEGKTNFFDSRPTQYQRSSIFNNCKQLKFSNSEDF